jgi:hypothetical protein
MLFNAYMDESGSHDGDHRMVIVGAVGTEEQWGRFKDRFESLKVQFGIAQFHANEVRRRVITEDWPTKQRRMLGDGVEDIFKELALGACVSLSLNEYEEYFQRGLILKKIKVPTAYGICFRFCLETLVLLTTNIYGDEDPYLNIVLERPAEHAGEAKLQYELLRKYQMKPEHVDRLASFTLMSKGPVFLEAADLLAHSSYRAENVDKLLHARVAEDKRPHPKIWQTYVRKIEPKSLISIRQKYLRIDQDLLNT